MICAEAIVTTLLIFSASMQESFSPGGAFRNSLDKPPTAPVNINAIPPRAPDAISGSQFAHMTAALSDFDRQKAALTEMERGNLPDFMRTLYPIGISFCRPNGTSISGIIWVSPDYISIGSNNDFLRFPLSYFPAAAIARCFGCVLPTPKIVDTIYRAAKVHLRPQPLQAGPCMRSCEYCLRHQKIVEEQRGCRPIYGIIAGHKKDVVLTNRLWNKIGRIAIYGWHRDDRSPIQPLSTVHGENYADYSHGIRLIRDSVWIQGEMRSMYDVLQDDTLAPLLTYEGALRNPILLMQPRRQKMALSMNTRPDGFTATEP
jgi:hypothetical protein